MSNTTYHYTMPTPEELVITMALFMKDLGPDVTKVGNDIDYENFVGFGLLTSHIYRKKLEDLMERDKLSGAAKTFFFFLVMLIKNTKRIKEGLASKEIAEKFQGKTYFIEVQKFVAKRMVQYVNEINKLSADEQKEKFPIVNAPTSNPPMMALMWKTYNSKSPSWAAMLAESGNPTLIKMFLGNLWAAQLNMTDDLKTEQKEWEELWWEENVTYTNSLDKGNFKKGFQEKFWMTKSKDNYPFPTVDPSTKKIVLDSTVFSKTKLIQWFSLP